MKRPALQNKRVGVLRIPFRARKVFESFEKRTPGVNCYRPRIAGGGYMGDSSMDSHPLQG